MTAESRYADLVSSLETRPGVTALASGVKRFGSTGQLKVNDRIFAMLVRGGLVLKLPRDRVDELVGAGEGAHFDAGKGRPMREWLALSPTSTAPWRPLAEEAMRFVGGETPSGRFLLRRP